MHRSLQILQAIRSAIEDQADIGASVYALRTQSLSQMDQELPAVVVDFGADTAFNDWDILVHVEVHSKLEIRCTASAKCPTEEEAAVEVARLRSVIHRAVLGSDRTFGLNFVVDTVYAGAEAPDMNATTESAISAQVSLFTVHYSMDLTDPD